MGSLKRSLQSTYRFAYDSNNIYIGIDRKDSAYESGDYTYIYIATDDGYYNVKVGNGVSPGISGISFTNKGVVGGRTFEIVLNRNTLDLRDDFIRVFPGFVDVGLDVDDRINGISVTDTSTWLKVNLK